MEVRNAIDCIRDFAEQTQPVVANAGVVDHHEHLFEEAIDRRTQLLRDELQRVPVAAGIGRLANLVANGREAFGELTFCAVFEQARVDRASSALLRDVEGALEGNGEGLELRRASQRGHGLDTRSQVAD